MLVIMHRETAISVNRNVLPSQKSPTTNDLTMLTQQFTVGKLDAGMAILLSPDHHVVEFPATILPTGVTTGSIVDVQISRNKDEEARVRRRFLSLQEKLLADFGTAPSPPVLAIRGATQTSVTLEWKPINYHAADFRGIDVFRNAARLSLHVPQNASCVRVSGLEVSAKYDFHIVVRTSAGALTSNIVSVQTHAMDNLTGICVVFGDMGANSTAPSKQSPSASPGDDNDTDKEGQSTEDHDNAELAECKAILKRIGAKWQPELSIDTTHCVCIFGRGKTWERVRDMGNIPIVSPDFLRDCEKNAKIQPAGQYYVPPAPAASPSAKSPSVTK
jgi:hypothetical protein